MKSIVYLVVICILFASIGQVSSDLYLPSLPAIIESLHTSSHLAQATVFLYMLGFACSRLVYGPVSDAIGRKKPLMIGLFICLLGTILCFAASSITMLIIGRFIQGLGSGAGVVIAGAIIRDMLEGENLAKMFSYLGIANIILIANAPLLGGYFQHLFGWRANFIFLFLYTFIALFVSVFFLSETNKHKTLANLKPSQIKNNIITLFISKEFIIYGSCIFLVYAGILAWLTMGPILLENFVGITPIEFGWCAAVIGIFYALAAFINSKLVDKQGINKMLIVGALCILIGGIIMLFFAALNILNIWVIVIPVAIFIIGASIIFPNAFAGALMPFSKIAGIAGAILGFIQISGGSLSSGLMSILPDNTQYPLAIVFIICGLTCLMLVNQLDTLNNGCVAKNALNKKIGNK